MILKHLASQHYACLDESVCPSPHSSVGDIDIIIALYMFTWIHDSSNQGKALLTASYREGGGYAAVYQTLTGRSMDWDR